MRVRYLTGAAVLCALVVGMTTTAGAEGVPVLAGPQKTLLEQRGLTMTAQEARQRIMFRPFLPSPAYTEVALLPPFHGSDKDTPENRGIGYEYVRGSHTYVLREWPRAGGSMASYPSLKAESGCDDVHLVAGTVKSVEGYGWATKNMVYALQTDDGADVRTNPRAVKSEWIRLLKRGACR